MDATISFQAAWFPAAKSGVAVRDAVYRGFAIRSIKSAAASCAAVPLPVISQPNANRAFAASRTKEHFTKNVFWVRQEFFVRSSTTT
jgi:hypothetical protein